MNKRERIEAVLSGQVPDRPPAMLWRHWPGDDQRAADLARTTLMFQRMFEWDIVKITPHSGYCVADYGVQTEHADTIIGDRTIIKHPVRKSLEWTELRTLDPARGDLGKHQEAIRLLGERVEADTPILTTVYSPLTQAAMIGGQQFTLQNMRTHADRLRTALNTITESTLRLIDALKRAPLAGIFYVMDYASFALMSAEEYAAFSLPFDRKILESLPRGWWLNFLNLSGDAPMFELAASLPVQAINWNAPAASPDLERARTLFPGVLCGGLLHKDHVALGTPSIIRDVVRSTITTTDSRRFIVSTAKPIPVNTPISNMAAIVETIESMRLS